MSAEQTAEPLGLPHEPPSPLVGEGLGVRGDSASADDEREYSDKSHREKERRNRGHAKAMRRNPTEAERKMWLLLKDRRFAGYKFPRQVPIGRYIADFVCHSARLIVELDGSQHQGADSDRLRDKWFEAKGFATLHIWNNALSENPESVSDAVWAKLQEKHHG